MHKESINVDNHERRSYKAYLAVLNQLETLLINATDDKVDGILCST